MVLTAAVPSGATTGNGEGCANEVLKIWDLPASEIARLFGVEVGSPEGVVRHGNDGWVLLSGNAFAKSFFNAYNVALHGVFEGGEFHPEHFIVRSRRTHLSSDVYRIPAAFRTLRSQPGWVGVFLNEVCLADDWHGSKMVTDTKPLQSAFQFAPTLASFLLIPESFYAPPKSSERLLFSALSALKVNPPERVLVVGSGSGYDAIGVAKEFPEANVVSVDISESAIAVGNANAALHHLGSRVSFSQSDLFSNVQGKFDAILFVIPRSVSRGEIEQLLEGNSGRSVADPRFRDSREFDWDGKIRDRFVKGLQAHLSPQGSAFIMTDSRFSLPQEAVLQGLQLSAVSEGAPWNTRHPEEGDYRIFQVTPKEPSH
jgi:SAM-dependent methyltransferase